MQPRALVTDEHHARTAARAPLVLRALPALLAIASALASACASVAPHGSAPCPTQIHFGGLDWSVSNAAERFPGAARGFAWNECNVKIESLADGQSVLVLSLRKEAHGWRGAQIESENTFQYGTFALATESSLRPMLVDSPSAVLGFFAYVGPAYANEIDMEFTRWGNPAIPPMHYTVWHNVKGGATPNPESSFASGVDSEFVRPALHRFIWTDHAVTFGSSARDRGAPIGRPFIVHANVPTKPMHIMLNLWVERQANMGTATEYEVRISSVTHTVP
ncbi:MAG: glycoside hydrolase family 16 protein [Gemmatimonadaceae bacterium]